MLKFIRGKGQPLPTDRSKNPREQLFAFNKTVHHGFPNKPTALAWDAELRLIAIANSAGTLKVFGEPGVEFYGNHHAEAGVSRILFVPNQGRLVTRCGDNSLHLWEITETGLNEVESHVLVGKLKSVSAMCMEFSGNLLLLGTEGGNVYFIDLKTFCMLDTIIYLDIVMQNVSSTCKTNPGAVEAIAQQPESNDTFLIGYSRGLIVLWDRTTAAAVKTFVNTQQLESICWNATGEKFVSSHNDGSYAFWDINLEEKPCEDPTTLYGPFPCKPVTKLIWKQNSPKELLIFSGGMPRASYSDKYTVTVYGKTHAVLDFTSKVIDFIYMDDIDGDPCAGILLVLTEEELVAVNLQNEDMKMISMPYLASLHASAITCSVHACGVNEALYLAIKEAGEAQHRELYSEREWPKLGGRLLESETVVGKKAVRELLLTGHEDGTIRFWECGGVALQPLYKFSSAPLFANEEPASPIDDEEEWPPFKKIGTFDPYSDDPRLAIKKVWLCPDSGTLVAAGTAGHVIILQLGEKTREDAVPVTKVNVVSDRDNFVWKGHDPLTAVTNFLEAHQSPGLQLTNLIQLYPPAAISAISCYPSLGLLAIGTAHGLALVDILSARAVLTKCTLNPNDISGAGDAPISRRKSFKKSLRESFRRLRKGRSTARGARGAAAAAAAETKPVERAIEARPQDDGLGSVVRCLHIASTFLVSLQTTTPTFWAGTNNGTVYAFTINMPPAAKRREAPVVSQLGKEIQLKHRAPVLSIHVVDNKGCPVKKETPPPHRVLIISEEQIKIFSLPSLKPLHKLKLTAHEGCLLRKAAFASFSSVDGQTADTCLMCLTNFGDVLVLSVPDLRRQLNAAVIPPEDINGITSLTFTELGEAFYLHSSSELQRISLAAAKVTKARCRIDLPESTRLQTENGVDSESDTDDDDTSADSDREQTPMVNGTHGRDDDKHDLSVGDITVDSVKDHLLNSNHTVTETTIEESKFTVVKNIISETTITTPPKTANELTPNLTSTPAQSQTSIDGSTSAPLAEVED